MHSTDNYPVLMWWVTNTCNIIFYLNSIAWPPQLLLRGIYRVQTIPSWKKIKFFGTLPYLKLSAEMSYSTSFSKTCNITIFYVLLDTTERLKTLNKHAIISTEIFHNVLLCCKKFSRATKQFVMFKGFFFQSTTLLPWITKWVIGVSYKISRFYMAQTCFLTQ